ncbi:SBBP repeat-containing protein [Sorangium sp. So ce861]|uniref:SBBP repeat-containing protein n=1 Tax=Sorangium sp. So ce861 TaxID=3133323 RepID=UPI003F5FBC02
MRRSGYLVLFGALGAAGALGGCFDKGVIAMIDGGAAGAGGMGGGPGGDGGAGGAGGAGGGVGGATSSASTGDEPCVPCYDGPPLTLDSGECKEGCLRDGVCVGQVVPTAEGCATEAMDESCDGEPKCTGKLEWSMKIGEGGAQYGHDIAFDRAGNLLVAGRFTGDVGFATDQGSTDAFVVKLDPAGTRIWGKAFGGNGSDACTRLAYTKDDGVIVAGTYDNTIHIDGSSLENDAGTDVFVAKLDANGDLDWMKSISGPAADTVQGLAVDAEGDIFVAGSFIDRARVFGTKDLISSGGEDIFVAKIDAEGNHVWSVNFGNPSEQVALDAAATPDGGVVLVGSLAGNMSFGGTPVIPRGYDAFMVKLDRDGVPRIAKTFGDDMAQEFVSVAVDARGGIVVAGISYGTMNIDGSTSQHRGGADAVVAAFDPEGKPVWSRQFGNQEDQKALGVAVDQAGNVIVVGEFARSMDLDSRSLESRGDKDAFLAKFTPDGTTVWAISFGDTMAQSAADVAVGPVGVIALTGDFDGRIDLGGAPLASVEGRDAFVAKLQP